MARSLESSGCQYLLSREYVEEGDTPGDTDTALLEQEINLYLATQVAILY